MKNSVLFKLRCVDCSYDQLNIDVIRSNGDDIHEGSLKCDNCRRTYTISKGIAVLLPYTLMQECLDCNRDITNEDSLTNALFMKSKEIDYYDKHLGLVPEEEQNIFYGTG